jgi:hypothetical protein
MASRSPTLRASVDNGLGPDAEKLSGLNDSARANDHKLYPASGKRRSSMSEAWRRRSENQEKDPFGDDVEEGDVNYRTLKWW